MGRMFGSATYNYSAELWQKFGVTCSFAFMAFCTRLSRYQKLSVLVISY